MHNTATATIQDLDRHAEGVRAGFASMNPAPVRRRFINPNPEPTPEAKPATPPVESTDARVLREAGIVGKPDIRWTGVADVTALTGDILSKKEAARLAELQAALDRLSAEILEAGKTPITTAKVAATFPAGDLPPAEAVTAVVGGDDARNARKKLAKESARRFFAEECEPLVRDIFARVAELLESTILERRKAEEEVFEKFAALYHDDDVTPYKPSPSLLRMCARRRQLLDMEIPFCSPPSLRHSLAGIVVF